MQVFFYITMGFFIFDIVVGIIDGIIEGKRLAKLEKRLRSLEQRFDEDIFDLG